jgi:hypothetical protein
MRRHWGVMSSALDGSEWPASRLNGFTPGEKSPWHSLERKMPINLVNLKRNDISVVVVYLK